MLVQVLQELLGAEVSARDSALGRVRDVYFDRECWQVSYLLAGGPGAAMLISAGCVAGYAKARQRVSVEGSGAQLRAGAGAWPAERAAEWLDDERICSAREAAGFQVLAADGPAGRVADLVLSSVSWTLEYVIASACGVLGPMRILVPLHWADELDRGAARLRVRCTRAELRSAPVVTPYGAGALNSLLGKG